MNKKAKDLNVGDVIRINEAANPFMDATIVKVDKDQGEAWALRPFMLEEGGAWVALTEQMMFTFNETVNVVKER